jgi:Cu(I)/Ag(I) efflux system membrane fusion protein
LVKEDAPSDKGGDFIPRSKTHIDGPPASAIVEAEIDVAEPGKVLVVPQSAVLDSGLRKIVLLDLGEGRFAPRDVAIGRRGEGSVEIRNGLAEGDKVVTSANFLIDSESNLKAALQSLAPQDKANEAARP